MPEFERVRPQSSRYGDAQPRFSIHATGQGYFNATATSQWLEDVDEVAFYHAEEDRLLGVSLGETGDGSYRLYEDKVGRTVSFRGTLSELGLSIDDVDEAVSLELEFDASEGLLVADLSPLFEEADS
ncbi:hypothetical protein ACFQH6_20555 [Halobacteriaceae archaeon GCM10025711]